MSFALLWSKMLRSSLWLRESKETKLLWVTLLMLKDKNGLVHLGFVGLVDASKLTEAECRESLAVLMRPDPESNSKVMEGRKVVEVPGGWQIVNHESYQFSTEERREYWRKKQEEYRVKKRKEKK